MALEALNLSMLDANKPDSPKMWGMTQSMHSTASTIPSNTPRLPTQKSALSVPYQCCVSAYCKVPNQRSAKMNVQQANKNTEVVKLLPRSASDFRGV